MHLPEFVLLVLSTVAAIAAGLAVQASKYSIARVLFWLSALSFWSWGVVWSVTSEGYSLPTQMLVSATIGALAAAGLTWVLWEISTKEKAGHPTPHAQDAISSAATPIRGPTLEATNKSKIDATGAQIPGDLPFQFGRAHDSPVIDMAGAIVTRNEDGSITVTPGRANRQFPPPTGEFANISPQELRGRIQATIGDLRRFQEEFNARLSSPQPDRRN